MSNKKVEDEICGFYAVYSIDFIMTEDTEPEDFFQIYNKKGEPVFLVLNFEECRNLLRALNYVKYGPQGTFTYTKGDTGLYTILNKEGVTLATSVCMEDEVERLMFALNHGY